MIAFSREILSFREIFRSQDLIQLRFIPEVHYGCYFGAADERRKIRDKNVCIDWMGYIVRYIKEAR